MTTLLSLATRMRNLTGSLANEASRCAVETAIAIQKDLTLVTPVDTSTALSNWDITIESPANNFHEPYFIGKKGSTKLRSASKAQQTGIEVLANKKAGQTIFITNNAPYIRKLNNGSSSQEPAGFVQRSVIIGKKVARKFKVKL